LPGAIRVDGWVAHPHLNAFTSGDETVRVEPKVMELFVRLAESPGRVVSKAELLDSVWAGVVVGEDSLTRAMSELRRALGDDARKPRIVETIPKRGYRLVPAVIRSTEQTPEPSQRAAGLGAATGPSEPAMGERPVSLPESSERSAVGSARRRFSVVVAAFVSCVAALLLWSRPWVEPLSTSSPPLLLVAPLEDTTGRANLGQIVVSLIEEHIGRDGWVIAMPETRLAAGLARMRRAADWPIDLVTAQELMVRDGGVAALATGRITQAGDEISVSVRLVNADAEPLANFVFRGATEAELRASLAAQATFRAVAASRAAPRRPLPPVTTPSLQALQLFASAVETAEERWASITGPWDTVVGQLTEALRLDPGFAMAKVWLAMVLRIADEGRLAYVGGEPMPPEHYRQLAGESLDQLDGLSTAEQLFVRGAAWMLLEDEDQALVALEALQAADPSFQELRTRLLLSQLYYSKATWRSMVDQAVAIAELRPDDFDANADAAMAVLSAGGNLDRARRYVVAARALFTPQIAQRENSCWRAAWLEHFDAFEHWSAGDVRSAAERLRAVEATISVQSEYLRDALATTNGVFWLTLGRVADARRVFELGGHTGQLELNLSRIPELFDDWPAVVGHLDRIEWAHNPVPFAQAGLFDRANEIIAGGYSQGPGRRVARGLEAGAAGRYPEATKELQQAVDMLRDRPTNGFYVASLALADVWASAGSSSQVIRVLEETVATAPAYGTTGPAGAAWIKAQVRLVGAYRQGGRHDEAEVLAARVRALLSLADPDLPLLADLGQGS
jgi:DNA-binding winged helix-turn-helix (wHTH) protein/tetratricopeptide (TPR) repeat protein